MRHIRRLGVLGLATAMISMLMTFAASPASANTPLPHGSSLQEFVTASAPNWNFARANNHDTCWPSDPLPNGQQASPAALKNWPVAGQGGCPDRWSGFPTFYTVKNCGSDEVRVGYTIFFKKNGFKPGALGHDYDFENIIVVWKKDRNDGGNWYRDRMLLSRHGHYATQDWDSAESWYSDWSSAGLGRDIPRIFVGWGSHAMFNHQGGLKDVASQYNDNEYRHADYSVRSSDWLIETSPRIQGLFDQYDWGKANTTPAVLARDICGRG